MKFALRRSHFQDDFDSKNLIAYGQGRSQLWTTAGITDWYAFVSYDDPSKVTIIMDVDPLPEPSNGPNYFPFDPVLSRR